jgi:hypothetical protein
MIAGARLEIRATGLSDSVKLRDTTIDFVTMSLRMS